MEKATGFTLFRGQGKMVVPSRKDSLPFGQSKRKGVGMTFQGPLLLLPRLLLLLPSWTSKCRIHRDVSGNVVSRCSSRGAHVIRGD